jgi:2-dehydro-3-deoxygalactonokinase
MSEYHILGDWGTSNLRLFRIENGAITDRLKGPGIGALPAGPAEVFGATMAPWLETGRPKWVQLCGMAGARDGWVEVPYVDCPADAAHWSRGSARFAYDAIPVSITAGLACTDADGIPDVMRGEETQIFGAIALTPALAKGQHVMVLPGTHSKWVLVEDGRVVSFRTALSGELFALLRDHSTLLRAAPTTATDEAAGFETGLDRAGREQRLLTSLFATRALQLRAGRSPQWAAGYLSGLIIGNEIAEMTAIFPTVETVQIVGDPALGKRYAQAFTRCGIKSKFHDGDASAQAGLNQSGTLNHDS